METSDYLNIDTAIKILKSFIPTWEKLDPKNAKL